VSGDQVQIYEPIILDHAGRVTTSLLSAVRYAKDNRLLPEGFAMDAANAATAVHGAAAADPDFAAGGDSLRYRLPLGDAALPVTITAQFLFQPIGHRWARNLEGYESPETERFVRYYEEAAGDSAALLAVARRKHP
jgi:hypothetical protein